jgi:hypothetical protein
VVIVDYEAPDRYIIGFRMLVSFLHEKYWGSESTVAMRDHTLLQQVLNLTLNLCFELRSDTVRPHRHWTRTRNQWNMMIVLSSWRQTGRLSEHFSKISQELENFGAMASVRSKGQAWL